MTIKIERGRKKARRRKKKRQPIGFTNKLALYLMLFLAAGLAGGFILAWKSIEFQYMGALACFTVVFTPVGTAIGIVLNSIVRKSEHENTSADGEGIKYAAAKAAGFLQEDAGVEDSPAI
jgi:hypothetical protein